jgi:hypothetical protein
LAFAACTAANAASWSWIDAGKISTANISPKEVCHEVALATFDLLACVEALVAALWACLDRLRVDDRRRRAL